MKSFTFFGTGAVKFGIAIAFASTLLSAGSANALPDEFLKTNGSSIRSDSGKGNIVTLRGVNLGGWLVFEGWQTPMDSSGLKDDLSVRDALTARFGALATERLIDAYQDAWITESDLDKIHGLGMNVVRLPFWYRNLESEDGHWRVDAFQRLDWLVTQAGKRGIYTILDLHGVPGGQSKSDSTGKDRPTAQFWSSDTNVTRAEGIWTKVAEHFRGNAWVAGYDLLNEPAGAPDRDTLWDTYSRLYRSIRNADHDHIVFVEGCWGGKVGDKQIGWGWDSLPPPSRFGWSNVVYEMHMYGWSNPGDNSVQVKEIDHQLEDWKNHQMWGLPCLIGEFNCFGNEAAWRYAIDQFDANGFGYTQWTFKATHGSGDDSWGIYNPKPGTLPKPDLSKDSQQTIHDRWANATTEKSFTLNPMLARVLAKLKH